MRYLTLQQLRGVMESPHGEGWANLPAPEPTNAPRRINVSALPADKKRAVWNHLQQHEPAIARVLTSPQIQLLKKTFEAELLLPLDLVQQATRGCK